MSTEALSAYHGDQAIKDKYIQRMKAHMDADELIRGTGFENGKGCAVGCTLNKYKHSAFPDELGVPEWAAHLLDTLHESTSDKVWPTLSMRFLTAITPGANLESVRHEINLFILQRSRTRVEGLGISGSLKKEIIPAIDLCLTLHAGALRGVIDPEEWSAAESAARSAARSAWSAAESAAKSADSAARSAAWSAESAARSAEYDAIAEEFIRLLAAKQAA